MSWPVPRWWLGQTVAVLATGPSLNEADIASVRSAECRVIAVNDSYRLAPFADLLYACDARWWQANPGALNFAGLKGMLANKVQIPGVLTVENGGLDGFDERRTHVRNGGNSGYQAVHLAAHLGAAKILLLGFDMRLVGGKRHYFGDHKGRLNQPSIYKDFIRAFGTLAPELANRGVQVINCTHDSALDCFPRASLETSLHRNPKPAAVSV